MKSIDMTDIECKHPSRRGVSILVPGGWTAYVGEVTLDEQMLGVYARYLGDEAEARALAQRVYESGFMAGLRHAIQRRAQEYATLFPDLEREVKRWRTSKKYVVLDGFDPEKVQACYVPFDNTGRQGKAFAEKMLQEMGAAARKAAA